MPQTNESTQMPDAVPGNMPATGVVFSQTAQLSKNQIQILVQMIQPELACQTAQARTSGEEFILNDIAHRISAWFHYDNPSQMPARFYETFFTRLEDGIEEHSQGWSHCASQPQAMKEVLEKAFDWGLISGIMNRPKKATLH